MTPEMLIDSQDLVVSGIELNSAGTLNIEVGSNRILNEFDLLNFFYFFAECSKIYQRKYGQEIRTCLALLYW